MVRCLGQPARLRQNVSRTTGQAIALAAGCNIPVDSATYWHRGHFARDTSPHANELKVVVVARRHECKPPRVSPTEIAIDLVSANASARRDMKSRVLNFELTLPAGSDD